MSGVYDNQVVFVMMSVDLVFFSVWVSLSVNTFSVQNHSYEYKLDFSDVSFH